MPPLIDNKLRSSHTTTIAVTLFVTCAVVFAGAWALGGLSAAGSVFGWKANARGSYICNVVICPLRMTVTPTTVSMKGTDSISGRLQVQSDADQPVILTYLATNACTGEPVPANVLNVRYDRNASGAGSGDRAFMLRTLDAPPGLYGVTLTGLRGTVSWSTRLEARVAGGRC
jgi:hypothetical protein